jgi:hypothetical protein
MAKLPIKRGLNNPSVKVGARWHALDELLGFKWQRCTKVGKTLTFPYPVIHTVLLVAIRAVFAWHLAGMNLLIAGIKGAVHTGTEKACSISWEVRGCALGRWEVHSAKPFKLLSGAHASSHHRCPGMLEPHFEKLDRAFQQAPAYILMVKDVPVVVPPPVNLVQSGKEDPSRAWIKMFGGVQNQASQHRKNDLRDTVVPKHQKCVQQHMIAWVASWWQQHTLQNWGGSLFIPSHSIHHCCAESADVFVPQNYVGGTVETARPGYCAYGSKLLLERG